MTDSLTAPPIPFKALAPKKLPEVLAVACQMFEEMMIMPVTRQAARRPKILENGIIMKFAYPSVITQTPRNRDTVASVALNSFMKIGVTGAIERAGMMENKTNKA